MSQNLYFEAFKDINKAKRVVNSDPQKAQKLFIEAYSYLKQIVNSSIENNKPSVNSFKLLGEMYLYGWGVEKNKEKAIKLLCVAKQMGNNKAKKIIKKENIKCPEKINYKELKQ
jgi:TPR repeat protein